MVMVDNIRMFRGKAKYDYGGTKKGDWVYGYYLILLNRPRIYTDESGYVEIIPETLGQFTGMKDINDTPIFEGDIIKYNYFDISVTGTIKFESGQFKTISENSILPICEFLDGQIIGNVHDNQ